MTIYRKNIREIDLDILRENVRVLRGAADAGAKLMAVVKADAYDGVYYGTPAGADRMPALAEKVAQDAVFQRDGLPSSSDQVVALSTCASSGVNERTLLLCRVIGERAADKA